MKIEGTRQNLFHANVSESDCSEVETETSKVKRKNMLTRWMVLTVENEKTEILKNLAA